MGTALSSIVSKEEGTIKESQAEGEIEIDLYSNQLCKNKKLKEKKDLTSAISEKFIEKCLKSGLKNMEELNGLVGSLLESDDKAELMDSLGLKLAKEQSFSLRCGACKLYEI